MPWGRDERRPSAVLKKLPPDRSGFQLAAVLGCLKTDSLLVSVKEEQSDEVKEEQSFPETCWVQVCAGEGSCGLCLFFSPRRADRSRRLHALHCASSYVGAAVERPRERKSQSLV